MSILWLSGDTNSRFPPVEQAFEDGLLAAGGDLSSQRILSAYRQGIFPWFNQNDPILWWSPNPRMVLFTDQIKISKSLKKTLRTTNITVTMDHAYNQVMRFCSAPRVRQSVNTEASTWIHPEMIDAYTKLHQLGYGHSVECWQNDKLVGGLYGIAIGNIFFGESMFSQIRDSSKIALVALCQQLNRWGFPLIDCQVYSEHLANLGAVELPRKEFIAQLKTLCQQHAVTSPWQLDLDLPKIA